MNVGKVIYGLQIAKMFNFNKSHYLKLLQLKERKKYIYICLRTEMSFFFK